MYSSFAQLGLVLSILLGCLVPFGFIWLKSLSLSHFKKLLSNIILIQFIAITYAFIALSYAYVVSDFSLYNVYRNSHQAIPLIYKFSGVWSNHEGSMLLWLFLLSIVNFAFTQSKLPDRHKIWIYSVQIMIVSSLLSYTILKSNPFIKLAPIPLQGRGFNPLLQDIALAIHPPILYLGYVSAVIPFAISIAALVNKELSPNMILLMQKWTGFSWSFLSLGVGLGAWWAYRELGWGGYWFWDPVENASILTWLSSIALIHSLYATKKLGTNYRWTILLAILGFLLAVLTSFIVRSGIVTSVHSFASDSSRGSFILGLLFIYSSFSLGLFAIRGQYLSGQDNHNWLSRFGGINLANIFWLISILIILVSLIYPLLLNVYNGEQISLEANFFRKTFIPVMIPIFILLALTLPATWQNITALHYRQFIYSLLLALVVTGGFYYYSNQTPCVITTVAFAAGALVSIRMCLWFYQRYISSPLKLKFYFIWLVHLAAGLFVMLVAFIEANSQELLLNLKEGDSVKFNDFEVLYKRKENVALDNYLAGRIVLEIQKDNQIITTLKPEIRYYPVEKSQTSEASIYHNLFYDLYAVINEITEDANIVFKLYYKPVISWLWGIILLIFVSGIVLIYDFKKKKDANF
jgi:cytochrome c-type biogenesis protein CcmF